MIFFNHGIVYSFVILNHSDGFSEDRIHSVLHQVELDLKHQKRNFGLMLATVSIFLI